MKERKADHVVSKGRKAVVLWFCRGKRDGDRALHYIARYCSGPRKILPRLLRKWKGADAMTVSGDFIYQDRAGKRYDAAAILFKRRAFGVNVVAHEVCHAYRALFLRELKKVARTPGLAVEERMASTIGGMAGLVHSLGLRVYRRQK